MNYSEKYFGMYNEATGTKKTDYSRNAKQDERKFSRIRKNIESNGANGKPPDNFYDAPVAEKIAPSENYDTSSAGNANNQESDPANGSGANANSNPSESLEDVLRKLNPKSNSQTIPGDAPVDKIFEAMPNLLMYEAGKIWDEVNGVLIEGADPDLTGNSGAVVDYILGKPNGVTQKIRNDIARHLLYKGMNWLRQYKDKALGK